MATFSEDGQWMWDGSEWIPAPPNQSPSVARVQMHDSVVGGDLNFTPQVHHHHNQQIIKNHVTNQTIHPMEDFSEVVKNAYESGKRALISLGFLVIFLLVGFLVGNLFDPVDSDRIDTQCYDSCEEVWLNDEGQWVPIEEKPFDQANYFSVFIVVGVIIWIVDGVFIFIQAGPINTFSRIREQYPASPTLEKGDKGKNLHNVAKYLWLAPLVIVIIIVIIGLIIMKISAEMNKHQNR